MENYKKEIGKRIKNRRRQLSLTQENIAENLNISVKHLSEVERGLVGLSVENLIKISDILGVSLDYLLKGKTKENNLNNLLLSIEMLPDDKQIIIKELINNGIKLANS